MLVAGLPGHYEPVLSEAGYGLFRKVTPVSARPLELRSILKRRVRLHDEIDLPLESYQAIWLRARAVPDSLGRLRALLYKPALINLVTTDDLGHTNSWRLLPRVAAFGFILAPTLAGGSDVASLMRGEAASWVRSFYFDAPDSQAEFWSHVDLELFAVPSLAFRLPSSVRWLLSNGVFDRSPISITSQELQQVLGPPELAEPALLLHAEGEIVFSVPATATGFSGRFGIRKGAYTGDGHTRGVDFSVEGVWASGRRETLWHRRLDPVSEPEDRGTQSVAIELPADPPATLVLHTGAGPDHDNRWDWSYVTALHFDVPGEK
jgi:hypothetical protein